MDNFDLKGFLRNNTLLKESLEEAKEERPSIAFSDKHYDKELGDKLRASAEEKAKKRRELGIKEESQEEVKTEGYGNKMKRSELKEKIREEILEAMAKDEEPVHEADEDGDIAPEVDDEIKVDAELDTEEPADSTEDVPVPSEDPSGDDYAEIEKGAQDLYAQSLAIGDEGLAKVFRDGASNASKKKYQSNPEA